MACSYCYARRMYDRFKWNPEIRYEDVFWYPGLAGKPGDKYFVGSTMELFGDWIEEWWLENIFEWVRAYPQRTFIFLTKCPQNLIKWSPFPENCWIGASPMNNAQLLLAIASLEQVNSTLKFLSLEPLLNRLDALPFALKDKVVDWIIIGRQTPPSKKTEPRIEGLKEIVEAADKAGIPGFLKNNLKPLIATAPDDIYPLFIDDNWKLRQEFPK